MAYKELSDEVLRTFRKAAAKTVDPDAPRVTIRAPLKFFSGTEREYEALLQAAAQPGKGLSHRKDESLGEGDPLEDRALGALLGAAVGDALGGPLEVLTTWDAVERVGAGGPAHNLSWAPDPEDGARQIALYTSNTQQLCIAARSLVWSREREGSRDPTLTHLGWFLGQWATTEGAPRSPGRATLIGSRRLERGYHWSDSGDPEAGGSGSLTRAIPFALAFSSDLERAAAWGASQSSMTHGAPIAKAGCAAMAMGVGLCLNRAPLGLIYEGMIYAANVHDPGTANLIDEAVSRAKAGDDPREVLGRWRGWAAHEAVAAATFVFARHAGDPRAALMEASGTVGASATVGALAGALVGALGGRHRLPADLLEPLEGRAELEGLAEQLLQTKAPVREPYNWRDDDDDDPK